MIKIRNFNKQYNHHLVSIKDISITKRITLIYGKNGSGKSTLLKAMAGFISYDGEITKVDAIGYASEYATFPYDISVYDFIEELSKIGKTVDVSKYIKELELEKKLHQNVSQLSKGMTSKLRFLVTVMFKKDLYLLDEPFSGVDQVSIIRMKKIIRRSKQQWVIASHILDECSDLCHEVIYLD